MSKPWNELTQAEREAHYAHLNARRESMKADPLLPCPFCGNPEPTRHTQHDLISAEDARHGGLGNSSGFITREVVTCHKCGAQHQSPNPDSLHWNTRI